MLRYGVSRLQKRNAVAQNAFFIAHLSLRKWQRLFNLPMQALGDMPFAANDRPRLKWRSLCFWDNRRKV
jgi:hypothetical protein